MIVIVDTLGHNKRYSPAFSLRQPVFQIFFSGALQLAPFCTKCAPLLCENASPSFLRKIRVGRSHGAPNTACWP